MTSDKTTIRLTLSRESSTIKNEKTAEILTDEPLSLPEFMEMVESLLASTKEFSKIEVDGYVLDWASDIQSISEN